MLMKSCPFLPLGIRFNAALSTDGNWAVILPKIIKLEGNFFCLCQSLWCFDASDSFEMLLNQTLICVDVPEKYRLNDYLLTGKGELEISLPVTWMENKLDWIPPIFKEIEVSQRLTSEDDEEFECV